MAERSRFIITVMVLGVLAGACGDAESTDATDAGVIRDATAEEAPTMSDAPTDSRTDVKVGEFSLQLVAPVPESAGVAANPGYTALLGKVFDGPAAEGTVWEPQRDADGCTLLTPRYPFCDPRCQDAVCVEDNTCQASPASVSAGQLTVKGLKGATGVIEFTVDPIQNTYQMPARIELAYPAFAEGDAIALSAAGDAVGAFVLQGAGIAPLVLTSDGPYPIASDQALTLDWTPAQSASLSRIHVKLDISHHGGTKGKIECDTEDDGSLTISAEMMTQLIALGVSGFPTVAVTRLSTGSTATTLGRVDLRIHSVVEQGIEIPGVISCTAADQCAAGETCRDDKTCG